MTDAISNVVFVDFRRRKLAGADTSAATPLPANTVSAPAVVPSAPKCPQCKLVTVGKRGLWCESCTDTYIFEPRRELQRSQSRHYVAELAVRVGNRQRCAGEGCKRALGVKDLQVCTPSGAVLCMGCASKEKGADHGR